MATPAHPTEPHAGDTIGVAAAARPETLTGPPSAAYACQVVPDAALSGTPALSGFDRRRCERRECSISVTVEFTQQTRQHPVGIGQPVNVIMKDISCTGVGVVTPFAFAKGDRLHIMIPTPGGAPLRRLAKVVSVRLDERQWRVGLHFIATE